MRRLFLRDCAPGDLVEDVLVVSGKQLAATSTGKHYIKAFVSDRSLQLTARMWNATRDLFNVMPEAGFLRVRGRVENYQNNLQFIIEQVWPAKDGSFDIGDLLPKTTKDVPEMFERLQRVMLSVRNRALHALVEAYFADEQLMADLRKAPAAMTFHHAFIGGLLEHTLGAVEVGDAVSRFYPGLNRDLVITGIFLHDLAKTWELCYDCAFGYTDGGQLVGHVVKSAMWVEDKARAAAEILGEPFPRELIDVLQHIILSHHGLPEHGAARVPSSPEALMVHTIENLDAKMMMALQTCRGEPGATASDGHWTEYLKAFGGRLYRPDVAPPDLVEDDDRAEPPPSGETGRGDGQYAADAEPVVAAANAKREATPTMKIAINDPLFDGVTTPKKR